MTDTQPTMDDPDFLSTQEAKLDRYLHLLPIIAEEYPALPRAQWPALSEAAQLDRAQGCLLGLAVGDALGAVAEGLPRDGFPVIEGFRSGGPLQLAAGEWTDATAMALCFAACLESDGRRVPAMDQYDLMERLRDWMLQGENTVSGRCIAIGVTTRAAIEAFLATDQPAVGSVDGLSAGNGSLIRSAPLAIACRNHPDAGRFLANKQSRATHGTIECLDACELFTAQLMDALSGANVEQALRPRVIQLTVNALAICGGDYTTKTREEIRSSSYVVDTLESALWAVWNTDNFRDAVLCAANLGGDASSIAAVAGQLAGALYGASAIPEEWLKTLAWSDKIRETATRLTRGRGRATDRDRLLREVEQALSRMETPTLNKKMADDVRKQFGVTKTSLLFPVLRRIHTMDENDPAALNSLEADVQTYLTAADGTSPEERAFCEKVMVDIRRNRLRQKHADIHSYDIAQLQAVQAELLAVGVG